MVARSTTALNDRDRRTIVTNNVARISFYETFAHNGVDCVSKLPE